MCHLSTRWIPSIMYGYHFLASCIHHQLPCRDPSQGVKYTCEITGSPATLVCSECPVYFATYDAQHETILVGDFWEDTPKKFGVKLRRFQKVLETWSVCTIHLLHFKVNLRIKIWKLLVDLWHGHLHEITFATSCYFVVLGGDMFWDIFHRYVLLAIERSPKIDYILLGIEPMGVNCNVNGRTWISLVLTEWYSVEYCFMCAFLKTTNELTLDALMYII